MENGTSYICTRRVNFAITSNNRADLAEWKNNLDQLVKRGKISENTRQRFEQG